MKPPTTTGRHDGVLAHDYHSWKGHISSSLLKAATKGPAAARHYMDNPPTLGWQGWFGTYIHALLLEPELVEGQGEIAGLKGQAKDETFAKASAEHGMPIPIAEGWIEQGKAVLESINNNALAAALLEQGDAEVTLTWKEWSGSFIECDCRARLDLWQPFQNRIIDIKTTNDPSESSFSRSAANLNYHIQAAHYAIGAVEALGLDALPEFWFIVIQNKAPFDVAVYRATDQFIAQGSRARREALDLLVNAQTTGEWSQPQTEPIGLSLPRWAVSRTDEEVA